MGRPRKRKEPETPKDAGRVGILNLKGSQEFADWLEAFHAETHVAKMKMVRLGLALLAEQYDFEAPPEI